MEHAPCGGTLTSALSDSSTYSSAPTVSSLPEDIVAKLLHHRWKAHWLVNASVGLGYAAFARFAASRRMHPMAGGFCRIKLDMADDYLPQRRRIFGIDRLELPASLSLSRTTKSPL
jgi:hypothetical protein